MSQPQKDIHDWLYKITNGDTAMATILWGIAVAYATDYPEASFWNILGAVKDTVAVEFYSDSGMD